MSDIFPERTRVHLANECGYAIFDETKNWPFTSLLRIGHLDYYGFIPKAGKPVCADGTIGDDYQGYNFFSVEANQFYYYVGTPGMPAIAFYEPEISQRERKIEVNKCGYVVIKSTKTFPHNSLSIIGDTPFVPGNYLMATGTPACQIDRKNVDKHDYSIGFRQGANFFASEDFWHYVGIEKVGATITLFYLSLIEVSDAE